MEGRTKERTGEEREGIERKNEARRKNYCGEYTTRRVRDILVFHLIVYSDKSEILFCVL